MNMSAKITKIYVGNLPESCSAEHVRSLFANYGRVEECDVVKNFAFVHMASNDEAKLAIEALNGTEFMGVKLSVEASHSKVRPKPGMGGKGTCYKCGKSGHWSKECPRNTQDSRNGRPFVPMPLPSPPPPPPPPSMQYPPDRYSRYGPLRYSPIDYSYERGYGRMYSEPYDRRPPPPPPPSHRSLREGYYYRRPPLPPPLYNDPPLYDEFSYDRRMRERYDYESGYDHYVGYSSGHASRRETIY